MGNSSCVSTYRVLLVILACTLPNVLSSNEDSLSLRCRCGVASPRGGGDASSSSTPASRKRMSGKGVTSSTIASMASGRRACGLYVWDAPSALLSRWCNHLQRDCVYEGLGGKKFVRIEPGSMLQLLYPCSQYSSDRCLLCGGTFRDHLTLWWAKHLYTPFDRFVDRVYRDGVVREIESSNDNYSRKMKALPSVLNEPTTEYAFHRRYVLDISHVLRGITSQQQRTRVTQRELAKWHPGIATDRMQQRRFSALNDGSVVSYAIPKEIAYEQYLKKSKPMTVATWLIVREMFLAAVERLMDLEATDQ